MSLQEMSCFKSAIFYNGCFKIMQSVVLIRAFIDRLSEYFIDPIGNWSTINDVFSMYGTTKTISAGSPSKDVEQGDCTKAPYMSASRNIGCIVSIFNTCEELGLLTNPDDLRVTYNAQPDSIERAKFEQWRGILVGHDTVKESETSMVLIAYAISNMYNSEGVIKYSPAQVSMFDNPYIKTGMSEVQPYGTTDVPTGAGLNALYSVLVRVPWNTIDYVLKPIIDALHKPWKSLVANIPVVDVKYTTIILPPITISTENIKAGNEESGRVPIDFAGDNKVFCLERALIVSPKMVSNPEYIDPPDPLIIPPIPEEVQGEIPPCFGTFGSRVVDPSPTEPYDPDVTFSDKFVCIKKKFPVTNWTPTDWVPEDPPEDPPPYPIDGDILVDGCPYIEECKKPHHISAISLDPRTGKLNVGSRIKVVVHGDGEFSAPFERYVEEANDDESFVHNPEHYHCINGKKHTYGVGNAEIYFGGPDISYTPGDRTPIKVGDKILITYRKVELI